MAGQLPPLVLEIRAHAAQAIAEMRQVGKEADQLGAQSEKGSAK